MTSFSVEFDSPMKAAETVGKRCRVSMSSNAVSKTPDAQLDESVEQADSAPPQPVPDFNQTTKAIETALKDVYETLLSQQAASQSNTVNYAVEIARLLLGSTDEIIETRLRQNVARVLDYPDEFEVAKVFVHSTHRDAIKKWLLDSETFNDSDHTVDIQVDDELEPGDCRVDFGQSGRLASLEEQLNLIESRLKQSIRDDQAGGGK